MQRAVVLTEFNAGKFPEEVNQLFQQLREYPAVHSELTLVSACNFVTRFVFLTYSKHCRKDAGSCGDRAVNEQGDVESACGKLRQ